MGPPQSYFDGKPREDLEHLATTRRRDDIGKKAQIALDKLNDREGDQSADRRHRESIEESRASRRLDKWALSVAVAALLVGGAGLWRSFLPSEPVRLLPAQSFSAPVYHDDPIPGTTPKTSMPATGSVPTPPFPTPDEKLKASPPIPKKTRTESDPGE